MSHTHVLRDSGGRHHLFYAAEGSTGVYGIGHASSTDGITWVRDSRNPILKAEPGTWHSKLTGGPSVLFRDGQVLLWFFGSERDDFSFVYFGLATADKQTF